MNTKIANSAQTDKITPDQFNSAIMPAQIDWRTDDNGNIVPVSKQFGDVYYSLVDGLAESRYVFLEQNQLSQRFQECINKEQNFTISELGFGTGLNFFATWQMWRQIRSKYSSDSHLHFISFEKHPLIKADFIQSLKSWKKSEPEIAPLIDHFISNYPTLVAGCHRINFHTDNLTLDLWLGDAQTNLAKLQPLTTIDAWFLDGFAPSCNESLWATKIFQEVGRLSGFNTSVATFSCAGIVKKGLTDIGFKIQKVKGFGRKREMLTARFLSTEQSNHDHDKKNINSKISIRKKQIVVVGAGVSGLMSAWSLANRGYKILLIDKSAPLAGASGNPRGLLSPKMRDIKYIDEHLHGIGYLYSSRLFREMSQSTHTVLEPTCALDLLVKANISKEQIDAYPTDFAHVLTDAQAKNLTGLKQQNLHQNQYLPQAGLINPRALADYVLSHPQIHFEQHNVTGIKEIDSQILLSTATETTIQADHAIICLAYESYQLDSRIFDFRKIRGQLSWFTPTQEQINKLPKIPLKYGGYCARFVPKDSDTKTNDVEAGKSHFLLGASFIRNDTNTEVREKEHSESLDKLITAIPELSNVLPLDTTSWKARAGIRSQTPDYHPLVGRVGDSLRIWTLSGMGAKGYAFAPICAEALADKIEGRIPPLSISMLAQLSPSRKRLQKPL